MIYFLNSKDSKTFIFNASLSANQGRAFKIDIIFIYDEQMLKTIIGLPNNHYFDNKSLLIRENPGVLSIYSVQILPGKIYPPKEIAISFSKKLMGCVVFADFSMVKGQISRKLVIGNANSTLPIYFDENGVQIVE